MALPAIIIPRALDFTFLGIGEVDVIDVKHSRSSSLTKFPVESGGTVSDHIQVEPFRLSVTGLVGNLFVAKRGGSTATAASAWQTIENFQNRGEPFDLITDIRTYSNMVIVDISTKRDFGTQSSLKFELTLEHLRFSQLEGRNFVDGGAGDVDNPVRDRPPGDNPTGVVGV